MNHANASPVYTGHNLKPDYEQITCPKPENAVMHFYQIMQLCSYGHINVKHTPLKSCQTISFGRCLHLFRFYLDVK